jgi:alpha-ketoglutarate-dependent taurine dioxygenase
MASPNCVVLPLQDKNMDQTNEQKRIHDKKINDKIRDPDYQLWWEWGKGDLVIVDLFCMYHAVKGGFLLGERILDRIYEYEYQSRFLQYGA